VTSQVQLVLSTLGNHANEVAASTNVLDARQATMHHAAVESSGRLLQMLESVATRLENTATPNSVKAVVKQVHDAQLEVRALLADIQRMQHLP